MKQVKMPKTLNFKPLSECLKNPEVVISDFAKFDRPGQLHLAFQAYHDYTKKHGGKSPAPWKQASYVYRHPPVPELTIYKIRNLCLKKCFKKFSFDLKAIS